MKRAWSLLSVALFVLPACNDTSTNPPPGDSAAPARVEDLTVELFRGTEIAELYSIRREHLRWGWRWSQATTRDPER